MPTLAPCPVCGAAVPAGLATVVHVRWHESTGTLAGWTPDDVNARFRADDAPTERLPALGDTVRRRPPVPNVTELTGPELVEALMAELERERRGGDL